MGYPHIKISMLQPTRILYVTLAASLKVIHSHLNVRAPCWLTFINIIKAVGSGNYLTLNSYS